MPSNDNVAQVQCCVFLRCVSWCDQRQCRKGMASLQHWYDLGACVRAEVKEAATQLEVRVRHRFCTGVVSSGWPFGMEERETEWVGGLLAPCTCHWV